MVATERARDKFFLRSELKLFDFCGRLRADLHLPEFDLDHENENEWGISASDSVVVRVSHAYASDTFHDWNPVCPPGCNYSVDVAVLKGAPGDWNEATRAGWRETWIGLLSDLSDGAVYVAPG
jgi:hypothetical protein